MSTVTLTIGPKSYPIACADGEEAHIEALGAIIAGHYAKLGNARAPLEAQNMLFAALFMADEVAEARQQLAAAAPDRAAALEAEIAQLRAAERSAQTEIARLKAELGKAQAAREQADLFGAAAPQGATHTLIAQLEALASRAEAAADALEAETDNA
ncbi:MAG: cell division protein ZapA [Erythrobacter sp.]